MQKQNIYAKISNNKLANEQSNTLQASVVSWMRLLDNMFELYSRIHIYVRVSVDNRSPIIASTVKKVQLKRN